LELWSGQCKVLMILGSSTPPTTTTSPETQPVLQDCIQCGWSQAAVTTYLQAKNFDDGVISKLAMQEIDGDAAQHLTLELLTSFGIVFGPATRILSMVHKKPDFLKARESFVSYSVQNWGASPEMKAKRTSPPTNNELVKVLTKKKKRKRREASSP